MEKIIKIICRLLGFLCIVLFSPPLVMYRIANIGNITGLAVGTVLLAYDVFSKYVNRACIFLWQKTFGKVIICLVSGCVIIGVITAAVITCLVINASGRRPVGDETLVVLGCQVRGTSPSIMLAERLDAAAEYMAEHEGTVCVLSGGQGPDEGISEAQCMFNYLTAHGIAAERLFMEDRSTSTRENLKFSLDIIEKEGLNRNIAIVTNEFHEYRAGKVAEKLGISTAAVPAKTHWWLFSTYYVREWYGIVYEWLGMSK